MTKIIVPTTNAPTMPQYQTTTLTIFLKVSHLDGCDGDGHVMCPHAAPPRLATGSTTFHSTLSVESGLSGILHTSTVDRHLHPHSCISMCVKCLIVQRSDLMTK